MRMRNEILGYHLGSRIARQSQSRIAVLVLLISLGVTAVEASDAPATPAPSSTSTNSSLTHTIIHLYYTVAGYTDASAATPQPNTPTVILCSAPGTQLKVGDDDGTTLTVAIDNARSGTDTDCTKYVAQYHQYKIAKSAVLAASPTIQGFVSGVLAVPFKFHVSDHSTTAGSTLGGYIGYRTSVANQFAVTPVIGGGLALVSTSAAQAPTSSGSAPAATSSQTSTGFSIAGGLIGSLTSAAASGAQFGILFGTDWVSKSASYLYNGKLWVAFEIGYNFAL